MKIEISGHHVEITEAIKQSVENKFSKIGQHYPDIMSLKAIVTVERNEQKIEVSTVYEGVSISVGGMNALTDENDNVIEVAEKKPISDKATVGIYYWKKGSDYIKYAKKMIKKDIRINNEFYICPVYNEALKDKKKIITKDIKEMWGLGTPEDLEYFIRKKF